MDDLISRQAAIDALEEYLEEYDGLDECGLHSEKWCAMSEAKMAIEALPSAQPEIIRCKDCKRWMREYLDNSGKHGCNVMREYTAPNDYCFKAERKE